MERLLMMNERLNALVWGPFMIFLLLLCGALLMVGCRFLPFAHPLLLWKKTLGSLTKKKQKGVTSFQAVATALAGTLGVGSIVGVATAITAGGPGALFWMCVSALFGMMTKYGEVVLALHYRQRMEDGSYIGGAMSVLEKGCHLRLLGVLFALFCIFASFGIGNLTPAQTITDTIRTYVPISPLWIGILLVFIIGGIIKGKAQRIMRCNELLVPLVSLLYIGACIYLLCCQAHRLPQVLCQIIEDAFHASSAAGGISGYAISRAVHYGISRGVFSNEAGMGSSPLSHAAVVNVHPVEQGLWGIFEVFFDTLVVCLLSGLMILSSPIYAQGGEGVSLLVAVFADGFGTWGGVLLAISILLFALPSILGWYYYATVCIRYLFTSAWVLRLYRFFFLLLLVTGGFLQLRVVWDIADTLNGLMAVPNLISLVLLYKTVVKLTKEYMRAWK